MTRLALAVAALVGALIVGTIAICYLGEALLLALETTRLDPAAATLLTGVAGLIVAALIVVLARQMLRPRIPAVGRVPAAATGGATVAGQLGGFVADQVVATVRTHPYGTVGAALVAGLAAGAIPELRTLLTDLVKKR